MDEHAEETPEELRARLARYQEVIHAQQDRIRQLMAENDGLKRAAQVRRRAASRTA